MMANKVVGLAVLLSVVFCLFSVEVANGTYDDGDGSAEFPYEIAEPGQLIYMSQHPEHWSQHFMLTADIDLLGHTFIDSVIAWDADHSQSVFQGPYFTGTFDGNGFTIYNLTINNGGARYHYQGMFGYIHSPAVITNLDLQNVNLTTEEYAWYVGGLCGYNREGTIANCRVTGTIDSGYSDIGGLCGINYKGYISNCHTNCAVTGFQYLGGLCGNNGSGNIINCSADGLVTSNTGGGCGGLCGRNDGTISYCYANSTVYGAFSNSGGLCGMNNGYTILSYATGSVSGHQYIGGLCGENFVRISYCYSVGPVTSWSYMYFGGLCGYNRKTINGCYFLDTAGPNNGEGTPLTDIEMRQQSSFVGWDFDPYDGDLADWFMPFDDYPKLYWQSIIDYIGNTTISLDHNDSDTIQIQVFSLEEETLNWMINGQESCDWIVTVDPNNGSSTGPADQTTVSIEIDALDLSTGDYTCYLTLATDYGGCIIIPVSLHVYNRVDNEELSLLAEYWLMTGCDQTQPCSAADWYFDHNINMFDFNQLALSWLDETINTVFAWKQPSLLIPWHSEVQAVVMPYITPDKLTLFYSRYSDPNGCREIVEATRTDPRGYFTTTRYFPELNGGIAPWLSTDRLRLFYNEIVGGNYIIQFAERADLNSPWIFVRTISEIQEPGYTDYRPTLTADELTMFWTSYRPAGSGIVSSIWMANRNSTAEPFANVIHVNELDIHTYNSAPCILPDGLTIYFQAASTGHPWMFYKATRNSLLDPFTNIKQVTMLDGTSFDGHTLFVTPDEKDLYFYSQWMGQGEGIHVSYYD